MDCQNYTDLECRLRLAMVQLGARQQEVWSVVRRMRTSPEGEYHCPTSKILVKWKEDPTMAHKHYYKPWKLFPPVKTNDQARA